MTEIIRLKPRSRIVVKAKVKLRRGKLRIITPEEACPADGVGPLKAKEKG